MEYNDVRGKHYKTETGYEHWDFVADVNLNYFEACATKYLSRWDKPTGQGVKDLKKAHTYIGKLITLINTGGLIEGMSRTMPGTPAGYTWVNKLQFLPRRPTKDHESVNQFHKFARSAGVESGSRTWLAIHMVVFSNNNWETLTRAQGVINVLIKDAEAINTLIEEAEK